MRLRSWLRLHGRCQTQAEVKEFMEVTNQPLDDYETQRELSIFVYTKPA
jgi:hypothetical protein